MKKPIHELIKEAFNKAPYSPGVYQGSRKLTKGKPNKRIVFFPSKKNAMMMPCESRLEADYCLMLEFEESIKNYRTQAITLKIEDRFKYTPDMVLQTVNGEFIVIEVKISSKLNNHKLIPKLHRIHKVFSREKIRFSIITEKQIHLYPDFINNKILFRSLHIKFQPFQIEQAKIILSKEDKCISLNQARNLLLSENLPSLIVDKLITLNFFSFDLSKKINENTKLKIVRKSLL